MIGIADLSMRSLVQQPRDRPLEWFIHATNEWLMGDISPNVDALIAETGLSGRQVERLTNRIYGAPPKLLARKYRALRIASSLSGEGVDWQDRSEEHTSELQYLMRISYAVFCLTKKKHQ